MAKKKRSASDRQRRAGRSNLLAFRAENARPALQHGIHAAMAGSPLPAGCEDIAARVDAIVSEMETDLGGRDELTAAKKSILASQRLCLTVIYLAERYLRGQGLLDKRVRPHPLLATCTSFANTLRHNALALGLERKAKHAGSTLQDRLAEIAEREATESESKPQD